MTKTSTRTTHHVVGVPQKTSGANPLIISGRIATIGPPTSNSTPEKSARLLSCRAAGLRRRLSEADQGAVLRWADESLLEAEKIRSESELDGPDGCALVADKPLAAIAAIDQLKGATTRHGHNWATWCSCQNNGPGRCVAALFCDRGEAEIVVPLGSVRIISDDLAWDAPTDEQRERHPLSLTEFAERQKAGPASAETPGDP